jgi:nitrogen fixation/metabolism regulation signal transduction histidine kinase
MRLFTRLALLMVLLVLLPALPAAWMARELVTRTLNLGLSAEIDAALAAGVRQAREQFQRQRRDLADSLDVWVAASIGRTGTAEDVTRAAARASGARLPGMEAVLQLPGGAARLLRGGTADTTAFAPVPAGAPPRTVSATRTLSDGSVLTVQRATSKAWRSDAQSIATGLQIVRGLQAEREALERGFWLPFLWLYAMSLLAAVLIAGWLARGILVPVQRLLHATQEVGAGNWNVRVRITGRDEINRLSEKFNDMIQRLDAQSRRLVDLETMAGWREMARALAHEIKNPLTPIRLTVEQIRKRYRGDDPEYAALLDQGARVVIQEVESLRNVVVRFQEFSRPVEPRFAPVDLNALVTDVGSLQRDLRVELDLAPNLGLIRADDDRLRQMMMNLTRNARTATAGGDSPCLRLATRASGDRVVLEVEDNGPGIPLAEREKVFEPYQSRSAGGLGLGLALVKGIVLAHDGSVGVEEGRWGGARFRVQLPRNPEASRE